MHALLKGQSGLTTHSGLQAIHGFPKKPFLHTQANEFLNSLQSAFGPQVMLSQVSRCGSGSEKQ